MMKETLKVGFVKGTDVKFSVEINATISWGLAQCIPLENKNYLWAENL